MTGKARGLVRGPMHAREGKARKLYGPSKRKKSNGLLSSD